MKNLEGDYAYDTEVLAEVSQSEGQGVRIPRWKRGLDLTLMYC